MTVLPYAAIRFVGSRCRLFDHRQAQGGKHGGNHKQGGGQHQVRALYRGSFSQRLAGSATAGDMLGTGQNQHGPQQRRYRGTQRVESLGQVEAAGRGMRRPQPGNVGVGRNLQDGDAGCQHEQGRQKSRIGQHGRSRVKQQAADAGNAQPGHDAALVTQRMHQATGRQRDDKVGGKETELDQGGLHVTQRKHAFQVRNQDVVQRGNQAPHEKQGSQYGKGFAVWRLLRRVHGVSVPDGCEGRAV